MEETLQEDMIEQQSNKDDEPASEGLHQQQWVWLHHLS